MTFEPELQPHIVPSDTLAAEHKRHAARVPFDYRSLARLLGFPNGSIKAVVADSRLDEVVFVIEDASLPAAVPGKDLQTVAVTMRDTPIVIGVS